MSFYSEDTKYEKLSGLLSQSITNYGIYLTADGQLESIFDDSEVLAVGCDQNIYIAHYQNGAKLIHTKLS